MSYSTVQIIMARIASASPMSPIAVYRAPDAKNNLEAEFASTVYSSTRMKSDLRFIGTFHNKMNRNEMRERLDREAQS